MPWVKVEDNMPQNPKVRSVSTAARWAYVSSICYAGLNRTSGVIPKASLSMVDATAKIADELLAAGLWEPHPAGWYVHDFLKYNRSKEKIEAVSETRSKAGSKGAANRWQNATGGPWQNDGNLFLSASGSSSLDPSNPARVIQVLPEPERQTDGNLLSPDELDSLYRRICDAWVNCTGGTIARVPVERLVAYVERTSEQWVFDAITTTGEQGKKSPSYTYAILENWIQDGRETEKPLVDPTSKFRDNPLVKAATAWKEANG